MVQESNTEATAQACSYCHSRKIRCVPTGKAACRACERNSIKCRVRHPKKLGRPRGSSHSAFSISQDPYGTRQKRPPRHCPSKSQDSSPARSEINASGGNPPSTNYFDMADPFIFALPSPSTTIQSLSRTNSSCWTAKTPQLVSTSPQSGERPMDTPETSLSPTGETPLSEADRPMLAPSILNFSEGILPHTPPLEEHSPIGNSMPSFLSVFHLYMETHEALNDIRAGTRQVFVNDLKDGRGAVSAIIKASELGTSMMSLPHFLLSPPLPGSPAPDQLVLFGFIAVLKGCELADVVASSIVPAVEVPPFAESMDMQVDPLFDKPLTAPIDNYVWPASGPSAPLPPPPSVHGSQPKLSDEHITALIRLDIHLSHLNRFITTFNQVAFDDGLALHRAVAARYRRRLSHLHTQIRAAVDSTMPAWD